MLRLIALALASIFLSTGCTIQVGGPESTESPSVTSTPESESSSPFPDSETQDEEFLRSVRSEHSILVGVPDSDLIGLGKDACSMLDNGATLSDILDIIGGGGTPEVQEAMSYTVGAGIGTYCPEHAERLLGPSA